LLKAKITGVGCYTPPGVLTNHDLTSMVETSDDWIVERTGIRERHIAAPDMATSDMAFEAGKAALEKAGVSASELDAILVCTVTPDMFFPSTACLVQHRLGAKKAWGFDLIAACSGFVYGLTTAAHLVEPGDGDTNGFIDFSNEIDGSGGDFLKMPAGGSRMPASVETVQKGLHYVHQDGQQVFKYAVRKMHDVCSELLARNNLTTQDVTWLIPHQANKRIICAVAERLGLTDRVIINIDRYGNTTAATIPLATREALESGKLKKGDLVLFAAVGAGYTVGANLWRWGY
jgi:3-oxoacyl-[acyl-carrier-protein] synthase-3